MKHGDILAKLARKCERLANPAPVRELRPLNMTYQKPKHTKLGIKCSKCSRLKSDYSAWGQSLCRICYRVQAAEKLKAKAALRELKMRLAREAGL